MQKLQRLQKQIDTFIGNESSNENEFPVANYVGHQVKDCVVIGITDYKRMSADAVSDRFADRDVGDEAKDCVLQAIVPSDLAASVSQPCLMNDERGSSQ